MQSVSFPRPRRACVYREKSERTGQLMEAFARASGEFLPVERDTQAEWGWFASLKSMKRSTTYALSANGIAVWHEMTEIEGQQYLVTVMGHGPSDEWVSSVLPLHQSGNTDNDLAYLTKMRRVSYAAILCLAPEDEPEGGETPGAADDAEAKARAESWAEQHRLAKDAIAVTTSAKRVDEIAARIKEKVAAGEMDPAHVEELLAVAEQRKKRLASAATLAAKAQKEGPAPEAETKEEKK